MNNLEEISYGTMVFMRGKYRLDEIGGGKGEPQSITPPQAAGHGNGNAPRGGLHALIPPGAGL